MACAVGALLHSGQICVATERTLVHKSVVPQFRKALSGTVKQVFGNVGQEAPILVAAPGVVKNKKLLADAVAKGAKVVHGDKVAHEDSETRMRPVVIEGVNPEMEIYYTESFGSTASTIPVESDEEAIRIANETECGLSPSAFTEDLRRGLKIAKQIETGAVHINSMSVHDETALPHGGAKKSGWGRFRAGEGMAEWWRTKSVTWRD